MDRRVSTQPQVSSNIVRPNALAHNLMDEYSMLALQDNESSPELHSSPSKARVCESEFPTRISADLKTDKESEKHPVQSRILNVQSTPAEDPVPDGCGSPLCEGAPAVPLVFYTAVGVFENLAHQPTASETVED
eukprot:Filipodium_phascolosomae@DN894_c0_g1_i1.p1